MPHSNAIKSDQLFRKALNGIGDIRASEVLGYADTSMITKMKKGEVNVSIEKLARLFDEMGVKIVPSNHRCFDPEKIDGVIKMAQQYMKTLDANKLEFED